ncbi:hypothetical protein CY34DRAFT_588638 [Suillus luteus UH-Slu-Lm8-n1]|uniref:Uncharacterized protein n=1 Tax=Suillus luteus UH-Slu-Lm8-n1 TaxID=930992 RepID=A0A0D0A0E2_9AGAM|nr:hypothetical protein CY34DRAFT_588638 [Suillus luteus UH-Slu-Lm8-n1]
MSGQVENQADFVHRTHFFSIFSRTTHASHPVVIDLRKRPGMPVSASNFDKPRLHGQLPLIHSLTYFPLVTLTRTKEQHSRHDHISALRCVGNSIINSLNLQAQ